MKNSIRTLALTAGLIGLGQVSFAQNPFYNPPPLPPTSFYPDPFSEHIDFDIDIPELPTFEEPLELELPLETLEFGSGGRANTRTSPARQRKQERTPAEMEERPWTPPAVEDTWTEPAPPQGAYATVSDTERENGDSEEESGFPWKYLLGALCTLLLLVGRR